MSIARGEASLGAEPLVRARVDSSALLALFAVRPNAEGQLGQIVQHIH
jgi:hypothetical protein